MLAIQQGKPFLGKSRIDLAAEFADDPFEVDGEIRPDEPRAEAGTGELRNQGRRVIEDQRFKCVMHVLGWDLGGGIAADHEGARQAGIRVEAKVERVGRQGDRVAEPKPHDGRTDREMAEIIHRPDRQHRTPVDRGMTLDEMVHRGLESRFVQQIPAGDARGFHRAIGAEFSCAIGKMLIEKCVQFLKQSRLSKYMHISGEDGGRDKDRTCDPFGVNEVLSR